VALPRLERSSSIDTFEEDIGCKISLSCFLKNPCINLGQFLVLMDGRAPKNLSALSKIGFKI
jgi:hypothetical protein